VRTPGFVEGKEYFMNGRDIMKRAATGAKADALGRDVWSTIGRRLALRRAEVGFGADRVAAGVGITVEEYRGYESGAPIPAFLLGEIADLLDRSVTWFFEGVAPQGAPEGEGVPNAQPVTYKVATVEHRIQALTESFRKLDFEGQQHLLAISRALSRANASPAHE
jgi:transcriptional regulator with XRE-family HTH domain